MSSLWFQCTLVFKRIILFGIFNDTKVDDLLLYVALPISIFRVTMFSTTFAFWVILKSE